MTGYAYPVGPIYVPSDWADHRYRTPPSAEPGTDYAAAYGTPVAATDPGTVIDLKSTTSGGAGRYVTIALDDGRASRDLHLSAIYVGVGYRVDRGSIIGASGASGYGSDYYYGAHDHHTLLATPSTPLAQSIDFEDYVGGAEPPPTPTPTPAWKDDDMDYYAQGSDDTQGRVWRIDLTTQTKRQLTPSEWTTVREAYEAAGGTAPLATPTSAQLGVFRNVGVPTPPPADPESLSATVRRGVIALVVLVGLFAAALAVDIYSAVQATGG